jgi:hypothetical protein
MRTEAGRGRPTQGTMHPMSLNQRLGYALGAAFVLVGLAGFAVTGGVGFTATEGALLGPFEVNPLHNVVHVAVGVALAGGAAAGAAMSRTVNMAVGSIYLLLGVIGFFVHDSAANVLALNVADHFLHLVAGGVAVGIATWEHSGRSARA